MKRFLLASGYFISLSFLFNSRSFAQDQKRDTVSVGIYVTSIHDIDFKQKEYTITFWLWLKYKNKSFDFERNLEIPQAKTILKSFPTTDTTGGNISMLMKLQCVMKDSWKITSFPFDRQKLRLSFENSQFDTRSLIFVADTPGKHYGRFTINGWLIDSFNISIDKKLYETAFGDDSLEEPRSEYSAFRVNIGIERTGPWSLFLKIFLGMYVAFLISYVCFYIHADSIDARFGLSVGSLFAVIGNKYIVDSALPDTAAIGLVDTLHGLTLLCIFIVIACTTYALRLAKINKIKQANRFDMISAQVLLLVYVILNIYFISQANMG
ncbi:MAG: hypothetical protein ABI741_06610 [Ferruginibacter sp.]